MTILQKPPRDRHTATAWFRFGHGDQRCVTPRHGSTKPLPKNKRGGSEAIPSTPGSVSRSDKQSRGVGKLHAALMKPRPNGTLALLRSVRRTMTPSERSML